MQGAEEVDVHRDSGLLLKGRSGGVLVGNARIVHQDVQAPVGGLDVLPQPGNVLQTGNVQLVVQRVQTCSKYYTRLL